jgi:hypothetical protein
MLKHLSRGLDLGFPFGRGQTAGKWSVTNALASLSVRNTRPPLITTWPASLEDHPGIRQNSTLPRAEDGFLQSFAKGGKQ